MTAPIYPLLFDPVLKSYMWGGRNLADLLDRPLPHGQNIAESWEIAAHADGDCLISNGCHAGRTLSSLQTELGTELCGTASSWASERGKFPLMVKLLDANQALSVQVHPNDDYARSHEGNELGKTEMWVVLHAKPDAKLILGIKCGVDRARFEQAIKEGRLAACLHYLPVQRGDHICVPAGTLHAILDGVLIAEIQQNSNTTYRVFDWDRLDAEGKSRPLHLDKALDVINFDCVEPTVCPAMKLDAPLGIKRELLCRNQYFVTERLTMQAASLWEGSCTGQTMELWGCLEGSIRIFAKAGSLAGFEPLELEATRFCLLPAALGDFCVQARAGAQVLRTYAEPK